MQYLDAKHMNEGLRKTLRFAAAMAALFLLVFVLAPLPIRHFAPMAHYVHEAEKNGISPGALYYSDVPITREAEFNNRHTVRYWYDMPKSRTPDR